MEKLIPSDELHTDLLKMKSHHLYTTSAIVLFSMLGILALKVHKINIEWWNLKRCYILLINNGPNWSRRVICNVFQKHAFDCVGSGGLK